MAQKAADFTLPDQNGTHHSLKDYAGKWLVLYFYPKDNTPGCTKEACSFRDARELIAEMGNTELAGVNGDSPASHKKFQDKNNLNFTLLSDQSHDVIKAYDSWKPMKFLGKEFLGTARNTFIINPKGEIAKEYRGVNPADHAATIIKDLQSLQTQ
jgi:peroxiredoxin Q/BCP